MLLQLVSWLAPLVKVLSDWMDFALRFKSIHMNIVVVYSLTPTHMKLVWEYFRLFGSWVLVLPIPYYIEFGPKKAWA